LQYTMGDSIYLYL